MDIYEESLKFHEDKKGKLEIKSKAKLKDKHDLSISYTPGVAQPCREIAKDKNLAYKYTIKANSVAVVSNGTAVLGLGNIGPYAAIPVMEGKAILFKEFGKIDAYPICIDQTDTSDIVKTVKAIAPVFGGINLEDISAPACFDIEAQLQDIGIPVMHDDQHGTAVVVLAALLNACKVSGKKFEDLNVTIAGAGAAGYAIMKILNTENKKTKKVKNIIVCDSKGILSRSRTDIDNNQHKKMIVETTNTNNVSGTLEDALIGADVFIGVSAPNIVTEYMVKKMTPNAFVFAMSNPTPEIMPEAAKSGGAMIIGTGRSDFPNQINNVLAFPGIFRGALDAKAVKITEEMKIAAAHAIADYIKTPTIDLIIPSPLDKKVSKAVARAVKKTAVKQGVVRKE